MAGLIEVVRRGPSAPLNGAAICRCIDQPGFEYGTTRLVHQDARELPMAEPKAISALNHLIETCRDGEMGFWSAAEHVEDEGLK